jgi:hypothetical protein
MSSAYIEDTYLQWRKDPNSVHRSWDIYFRKVLIFVVFLFVVVFSPGLV